MDYKLTFEDGSSAYLTHHGVKGMKWGVWNAETKMKYGADSGGKTAAGGGGGAVDDEEMEEYKKWEEEDQKLRQLSDKDREQYKKDLRVLEAEFEGEPEELKKWKTRLENEYGLNGKLARSEELQRQRRTNDKQEIESKKMEIEAKLRKLFQ